MKQSLAPFVSVTIITLVVALLTQQARAQVTWTGGGGADTNWGTAANWDTGVPTGVSAAVIGANASTINVASSAAVQKLTFAATAANSITLTMNSNFRIANSLTVDAGSAYDHIINSNSRIMNLGAASSNLTGNQTVTFTNNSSHLFSFNGNGTITMGSTGTGGATMTLALAGGGSFVINQKINQAASSNASTFNLTKTGSGITTLNNALNTYNGTTTINEGKLLVNGVHAGGAAYVVNGGGTLGGGGEIITAANAGVSIATGGKLDAGTAEGADTLAMNLGTGTLDLSGALVGDSQSLLFTLGSVSDKILLEGTSLLTIGTGLLEFADFSFMAESGFAPGTYTLFETSSAGAIAGSLGNDLTGTIGSYEASLSLITNGSGYQEILLTVVPEPSPIEFMFMGSIALLVLRRRLRKSDAA